MPPNEFNIKWRAQEQEYTCFSRPILCVAEEENPLHIWTTDRLSVKNFPTDDVMIHQQQRR